VLCPNAADPRHAIASSAKISQFPTTAGLDI
jgi:hypothetical protein